MAGEKYVLIKGTVQYFYPILVALDWPSGNESVPLFHDF